MRADIDRDGKLTVQAETELEAFALRCWSSENDLIPHLKINCSVPVEQCRQGAVEVAKTKTYTDEELRSFGALPPKTPEEPEWAKKEKLKDMSFHSLFTW